MFVLFGVDPNPSNMSERDRYCQLETCSLLPINHQQVWGVLSWEIFLATSFKHEKYGWQIKKIFLVGSQFSSSNQPSLSASYCWKADGGRNLRFTLFTLILFFTFYLSTLKVLQIATIDTLSFIQSRSWDLRCEWMTFLCLSSFKITVPSSGKTRCSGKLSSGQNSQ